MKIPKSMMDNFSFEVSNIETAASEGPTKIVPQVKTTAEGNYNLVTIILPFIEKDKIQVVLSQNALSIK
jgi:HSP20 family molecular chaperone IbpA